MAKLQVGELVPEFEVTTQDGTKFGLEELKAERTILYFYPKDNTSGCTVEAKNLRDGRDQLIENGFRIVGVSPDSEKSHQNFCAKHELNFTLLSDPDKSLCEAFGVWVEKSMYGRKYMGVLRTTFVIDTQGRVERIFEKVDTKNHYQQILKEYNLA
ncbi:MAG: thioredoxin-dependent thiol peroxidase [Rikenellaceae bacterium]